MTKYTAEEVYELAYRDAQQQLPLSEAGDDPTTAMLIVQAQAAYAIGAVFGFHKATEEKVEGEEPEPLSDEEIDEQVEAFMKFLAGAPETDEPEES